MTKNVMSVSKIPAEVRREKQSKRYIKIKTIMYNIRWVFREHGRGKVMTPRQKQSVDTDRQERKNNITEDAIIHLEAICIS